VAQGIGPSTKTKPKQNKKLRPQKVFFNSEFYQKKEIRKTDNKEEYGQRW
jgi:hypothetical protein